MKTPTEQELMDELDFERSERKSFVRELEDLEEKIIDLSDSIREKPSRQFSSRLRPAAPEWDGGLPPVGCECEVYPYFHKCKIVAAYMDGVVVHDYHDDMFFHSPYGRDRFRPIKTQAERELIEIEMLISKSSIGKLRHDGLVVKNIADAILAAGYRKGGRE